MFRKLPVEYYTDGRSSWQRGISGFFIRLRGVFVWLLVTLFSMGVPWWWPKNGIPEYYKINVKVSLTIICGLVGIIIIALFYFLRSRTLRSLNIKYYLHLLVHIIRDKYVEIYKYIVLHEEIKKNEIQQKIKTLLSEICEYIAKIFQLITKDETIACAIRLAVYDENKKEIYYKTFARSSGLNPQREISSEPISIKEGIPRFLREEKKSHGILIYNDIKAAAKIGAYKTTKNDDLFKDEIVTMMVAPLNAWVGKKRDMIGIIYITSRKKNTFSSIYVDQVAFFADLIGQLIVNLVNFIKICAKYSKLHEGEDYVKILGKI